MPAPPSSAAPLAIFISYAREDRQTAEHLAEALQSEGLSVWWDREILGGSEFSEVIEIELNRADVAIVLWSEEAVKSSFVRDESARALAAGKLLPVRIEDVSPPLGFGQIHTLDLIDWEGEADAPGYVELLAHVRRRLKGGATPRPARRFARRLPMRRRELMLGGATVGAAGLAWFGWSQFSRDSVRAQALTAQGIDKFEAKLFDPARFLFNQALEADDRYAPALFYRAQVLVQSGAPPEAAHDLRQTLKLRHGLDGAQLRDAERWLADLAGDAAEPAPVSRVAAAPAPPPPPAPAAPPGDVAAAAPPPASTAAAPPRPLSVPLAGAERARLDAKVEQMFSASKDTRIRATTELIVDAAATSDAVPSALQRALQAERGDARADPAILAGVINVLTLLLSSMPATLSQQEAEIRKLLQRAKDNGPQTADLVARVGAALDAAGRTMPIAYLQIASDGQRKLAERIAVRLRTRGYRVPAIETVGDRAPAQTEIRVHGRSDQGLARWMGQIVEDAVAGTVRVHTLAKVQPKVDTFEIWTARGLCTDPRQRPPACG